MKQEHVPRIGMRIIKTAVAVMVCYAIFDLVGLMYYEEYSGIWGQLGPLYACVACIVCIQSTVGQTMRQGISRLVGVAVGGVLGGIVLLFEHALDVWWIATLIIGAICVVAVWICLLIRRPNACVMACVVPCVILMIGVTGDARFYYAAARVIETTVGIVVALTVNFLLPDRRPENQREDHRMMMEVKNTTQKLCVIGDPVTHSKSPVIQNTMIHALNLDYLYLCQTVPRGTVADWLTVAKFAGYAGFNATMPHKLELVPLMDELDEDAKLFGAVNTVCIRDGKVYGYNTDGAGFINSLTAEGISVEGKTIVILGAGGAAKAVALKLSQSGAKKVVVCNRTLDKAQELCDLDGNAVLTPATFDDATLAQVVRDCHLLVNCTSLGMAGTDAQFASFEFLKALPKSAPVCDLIYHPAQTELLHHAHKAGHKTMNGMGLLVHQAVLSLEHFTQTKIDAEKMLPLIEKALQ